MSRNLPSVHVRDTLPQIAVTPAPDQIAARLAEYDRLAEGAFADNTRKAVKSDTALFAQWCADNGHASGPPADPETVAAFVDAMAVELIPGTDRARAPATIARYVSSIDHLQRAAGVLPVGKSVQVSLALRRMRRAKGTAQKQAAPMRWASVAAALNKLGGTLLELRDAALIALAYDTLARASELVGFQVKDIAPAADGWGVAYIARSKTDQDGAGMYRPLTPDTLRRVRDWIEAARLDPESPLFVPLGNRAIKDALTPDEVSRIYKRRVGVGFSAHSTRVGNAVEQNENGVPLPQIMQSGGWKSPGMIGRYTKETDAMRGGSAALARLQGRA